VGVRCEGSVFRFRCWRWCREGKGPGQENRIESAPSRHSYGSVYTGHSHTDDGCCPPRCLKVKSLCTGRLIGMLPHAEPATQLQYHRRRGNECAHHKLRLLHPRPRSRPKTKRLQNMCAECICANKSTGE
jgi:hypothetical protein